MAMIRQGPTIRSTTTGPLARQQGHLAHTLTLHGAKELANVMAQAPKSVVSAALKVSVQRGVKVVQEEIRKGAANLRGRWSYGVYSRSLSHRVDMGGRFTAAGTVGNLRAYREGPYNDEPHRRRPAKYWHWVEWGTYNRRTGRRTRAHHLLARSVMKAHPQLKRVLEAATIEVLSRHFKVPPLHMANLIASGGPLPRV